jgi:putative ABC transport system permease protein
MIPLREIFILSIRSILRNKIRSALTMLGIIIGVSSVILLVSLGQGLQKYITSQFEELGTNLIIVLPGKVAIGGNSGGGFSQGPPNFAGSKLTIKQADDLQKLDGAIEQAGTAIEMATAIKYKGKSQYTTAAAISANYGKIRNISVAEGRNFNQSDVDLSRKVAILGRGLADKLFGQSQVIGSDVTIGDQRFTVVGILKDIGAGSIGIDLNNFLAIPITTGQKVFNQTNVQTIVIKAKTKEDVPTAITLTKKYLGKELKDNEFSVLDQSSLVTTINQILGVLTAALGGIAAISLVVGGVGIMNIMLVSVTERTREIGLRKAVGAKESDIRIQFLIEAVVLSVMGGTIGILVGAGGAFIINKFVTTSVTFWSVMLSFGVSAAVGIVFGVAPAIRASRLDPIDALRYE